jgi:hypothetical protein
MESIYPRETGICNLGNSSKSWSSIYSRNLTIYDGKNSVDGGGFYTQENAESNITFTALKLGNGIASTDGSGRYGILQIYSTGTKY